MSDKLREVLESAKAAQQTIAEWRRDEHGRVSIHPDVIGKAVGAIVWNLEAALAESGAAPAVGQFPRETLEKCANYILRDVTMGWTRKRDDVVKEIVDLALLRSEAAKEVG